MALDTPSGRIAAALSALFLGDTKLALELLEPLPPFNDALSEVERLCLLGQVYYHQGRLADYQRVAQQAVAIEQSHVTLLHLGQSLPPTQAVLVLRESLAQARNPQEEGQVAYALARALERLGRYREGLSYASLALLRNPHDPVVLMGYASLTLMGSNDASLNELAEQLLPYTTHHQFNLRLGALHLLAGIALVRQDYAQALHWSGILLEVVSKDLLPVFVWQLVRIHLAVQQHERALQITRAASLSTLNDPTYQGLAKLALGQVLYPRPEAGELLQEAADILEGVDAGAALIARAYLCSLHRQPLSPEDTALLDQWSNAMRKSLPDDLPVSRATQNFTLETLGNGQLMGPQGPVALRPRGLELLVLLLSRPEGWDREDLELALYGQRRSNALRVELVRLKQALAGGLAARPWRITVPIHADFQELLGHLARGDARGSLGMYRGSLLPRSTAPGIQELRQVIDEEFRTLILGTPEPANLFRLSERFPDDLEVWEQLLEKVPKDDPRYFAIRARVHRLRQAYQA